jgi:NAD(P)-dependent dehydrogenase (short-subunit alcohol dehydrogenase family)
MVPTVLVTGATDGIGRETARQLLALGRRVLVHGRSEEKATRTARALAKTSPAGEALSVWGDLADMAQVVALAAQVKATAPRLHVLINNAGVFEQERRLTRDGFERTMAVNHFAPFLLTRHLLDTIQAAPAGRIVTVSSMAHAWGKLDVNDLAFRRAWSGYEAYCASKLANVLFTLALSRRLEGTRVTANCLHPGVIDTKLLRRGFDAKGDPVEEGARPAVYLATSEKLAGVSGRYFDRCREKKPAARARDEALAEALWQASEEALAEFL